MRPAAEGERARAWPGVALALFLTPGLGFLYLGRPGLALRWFLSAAGLAVVLAGLYFLDIEALANLPYAFVYGMTVNVAGALHAASLPPLPAGRAGARWYSGLLAIFSLPALGAMLAYGVVTVAPAYRMPNPSMEPTLPMNRPFLVLLPAYRWSDPARGDLVLYRSSGQLGEISRVSRVIGLPGDMVAMQAGIPVVNGQPLPRRRIADYPLTEGARRFNVPCFMEWLPDGSSHAVLELATTGPARFDYHPPYRVPEGAYFVISDNRDSARDSRDMKGVGFVPREAILGRAIALRLSPDAEVRWHDRVSALPGLIGL